MASRIKIRGIYSVGLTEIVSEAGYTVVQPSQKVRELFGLEFRDDSYDIMASDREDLQGISVSGEPEKLCQFLTFLQERLEDAVMLQSCCQGDETDSGKINASLEFPGASKAALDAARYSVTPTVRLHHRLKIINPQALDSAEARLSKDPGRRELIESDLYTRTIMTPLEKNGMVRLEHMRPSGKPMRPREGVLTSIDKDRLAFRRSFLHGRYDGLDVEIRHGDYGITEIQEGSWFIKHAYFMEDGSPIGEYYNINTPVELYPFGARYLDLEVDVVRKAGESPHLTDREKLALLVRDGRICPMLESKALMVAEDLMRSMDSQPKL